MKPEEYAIFFPLIRLPRSLHLAMLPDGKLHGCVNDNNSAEFPALGSLQRWSLLRGNH